MPDHPFACAFAVDRHAAQAAVLAATLGLAAACWGVALSQMSGMDTGGATRLGSFGFFAGLWLSMMAAMMLPGAAPAVVRRARAAGVRAAPAALPRERAFRHRLRAVLRRLEHRPDADVAGPRRPEHHLDGGYRRRRPGPEAAAPQRRTRRPLALAIVGPGIWAVVAQAPSPRRRKDND